MVIRCSYAGYIVVIRGLVSRLNPLTLSKRTGPPSTASGRTGGLVTAAMKATIESEGANIASLTTKVEELAASIATDTADLKA